MPETFCDSNNKPLFTWTTKVEHSPEVVEFLGCQMLAEMEGRMRTYIPKDTWTRKAISDETVIELGSSWRSITWVKPNRYNRNHKLEFMNVEDADYEGDELSAEFADE